MAETVQIGRRFCGPTESGHGGYTASILGTRMPEPAAVSLRLPPPLETDMSVVDAGAGRLELRHGEALVADAVPTEIVPEAPAAPDADAARATRPLRAMIENHVFENCFACGPARAPGDGLRIFVGVSDEDDGLLVTTWTPDTNLADNGRVRPEFVWAALDCPSGWAAMQATHTADESAPAVLARQTVRTLGPVTAGEEHIVAAWAEPADGRKTRAGSALYRLDGALCAAADTLWISLRRDQ